MAYLSKYGVARTIRIPIVKRGVVDFAVSGDWTPAAGDVKVSKDGGAFANVTNLPTALASANTGALWLFALTATEMQAAQVTVVVSDAATKAVEDQVFDIETYGNASAQHPFDLATATVNPGAAGITSASFAAGAINAAAIATDAIGAAELAADAVTEIQTGLATSAAQTTLATAVAVVQADTDDIQTRLPAALVGGRIDASVGAMAANVLTAAALAADADTEIATAVWAQTMTELAAVPGVTDTVLAAIEWVFLNMRNKLTATATTMTLRNDADNANTAQAPISDDNVTFVRGKFA